ncbi:MAG: OmpH family outer membrane protein [Bacteroidota bacterium]|nr:OmpH family outer membrane protein [Bacteroidota bacterium]
MKKYLLIAVAALFLVTVPRVSHAQTKASAATVAHINLDSLLGIMPAFKAASDSAQLFYAQLEQQMYAMTIEFQRKQYEYDSLKNRLSPTILAIKEKELYQLQSNIQEFQQNAQEEYAARRAQLLLPILKSIEKAVKDVAIARGYRYVLDSSKETSVVIYAADTDDIFNDVRIKLGIPLPPKPTPAPGTGTPK